MDDPTSNEQGSWTDQEPLRFARDLANVALATGSEHVHIRADFLLALLDKLSGDSSAPEPMPPSSNRVTVESGIAWAVGEDGIERAATNGQCADEIQILLTGLRTIAEQGGDVIERWSAEIARRTIYGDSLDSETSGWRPIQTAPRDGTPFIGYSKTHGVVETSWEQVDGGGHPENGPPIYWWTSPHVEFIDGPYDAPSHWMPLQVPSVQETSAHIHDEVCCPGRDTGNAQKAKDERCVCGRGKDFHPWRHCFTYTPENGKTEP